MARDGDGLHLHFALGMFVEPDLLETWGHGYVLVKRLPQARGGKRIGRVAADGYMSKYVSKSFDKKRTPGLHRYDVAQGFKPRVERIVGSSRGSDRACFGTHGPFAEPVPRKSRTIGRARPRSGWAGMTEDESQPPNWERVTSTLIAIAARMTEATPDREVSMLTVAYCRVSTEEQAAEGFSIEGQPSG